MADSKTQAIYLTTDGHYYLANCVIPSELGNIALNKKGNQAHLLDERPTFPKLRPQRCMTWQTVLEAETKRSNYVPERSQIIVEDQNGCPDEGGPVATVSPTEISLDTPITFGMFDTVVDSNIQRGLQGMAAGLVNWASITKVEVVVTTSSSAKAQTRANSVVDQLVKGGVAKERLVAVGKQGPDGVRFNVLEGPKPR